MFILDHHIKGYPNDNKQKVKLPAKSEKLAAQKISLSDRHRRSKQTQ
ncbi:MAG: hypothetical protein P2A85_25580 [Microcoleus anatoxicus]